MGKQTKDIKIFMKVTPEQHSLIKAKAKKVNMTMTAFARYLMLHVDINLQVKI